jgi:putative effector of murein hydrolase LrgA (UPF0299 family)
MFWTKLLYVLFEFKQVDKMALPLSIIMIIILIIALAIQMRRLSKAKQYMTALEQEIVLLKQSLDEEKKRR